MREIWGRVEKTWVTYTTGHWKRVEQAKVEKMEETPAY
jgi:hypothetical protein